MCACADIHRHPFPPLHAHTLHVGYLEPDELCQMCSDCARRCIAHPRAATRNVEACEVCGDGGQSLNPGISHLFENVAFPGSAQRGTGLHICMVRVEYKDKVRIRIYYKVRIRIYYEAGQHIGEDSSS